MIRLKSLYMLLGGDINHLQRGGIFEQYYEGANAAGFGNNNNRDGQNGQNGQNGNNSISI